MRNNRVSLIIVTRKIWLQEFLMLAHFWDNHQIIQVPLPMTKPQGPVPCTRSMGLQGRWVISPGQSVVYRYDLILIRIPSAAEKWNNTDLGSCPRRETTGLYRLLRQERDRSILTQEFLMLAYLWDNKKKTFFFNHFKKYIFLTKKIVIWILRNNWAL